MKNCQNFMSILGFYCNTIQRPDGEILYISTPFTLLGGKPIDIFIIERESKYIVTDDGFTMLELRESGFNLDKRTSWRGLSNLAVSFGFELSQEGAFFTYCNKAELRNSLKKFLHLASSICQWEVEKSSEDDKDFSLYFEVEALLKSHKDKRKLINYPSIIYGEKTFEFDFKWGEDYVDAIKPNQQAVNSRLRKSIQFHGYDTESNIIYIIDDRENYEKAIEERSILGGVSQSILLSDLRKNAA
jgi:hypothetical protein